MQFKSTFYSMVWVNVSIWSQQMGGSGRPEFIGLFQKIRLSWVEKIETQPNQKIIFSTIFRIGPGTSCECDVFAFLWFIYSICKRKIVLSSQFRVINLVSVCCGCLTYQFHEPKSHVDVWIWCIGYKVLCCYYLKIKPQECVYYSSFIVYIIEFLFWSQEFVQF